MLDRDGFRPNVGIILLNQKMRFSGASASGPILAVPARGIKHGETPEQAMFRELHEEVGLHPEHVKIVARTRDWLRYEVPGTTSGAMREVTGGEADLVPAAIAGA